MKRLLTLALFLPLAGCIPEPVAQTTKSTQTDKAKAAANAITFTENAEIDNITKRLKLTSQPDLLGYVALVNRVGAVVMYTPVKGKITSGSKRLTANWTKDYRDCGEFSCEQTVDAPSDEGTYGSSNPYIYFWTPSGRYIQTDMDYIYSDQPLRLDNTTTTIKIN